MIIFGGVTYIVRIEDIHRAHPENIILNFWYFFQSKINNQSEDSFMTKNLN